MNLKFVDPKPYLYPIVLFAVLWTWLRVGIFRFFAFVIASILDAGPVPFRIKSGPKSTRNLKISFYVKYKGNLYVIHHKYIAGCSIRMIYNGNVRTNHEEFREFAFIVFCLPKFNVGHREMTFRSLCQSNYDNRCILELNFNVECEQCLDSPARKLWILG
jgi:hypothetical protein